MKNTAKDKKDKIISELDAIEHDISQKIEQVKPTELLVEDGELPALAESGIKQIDYSAQLDQLNDDATRIVDSLAELYLGDEKLLNHPYITEKKRKDANYYGKLEFLVSASQNTLVSMMREIEMGTSTPRMFEVQSLLQKEMRENIKLSMRALVDIESFYKSIRADLGMEATAHQYQQAQIEETSNHVDLKQLNDELEEMMKQQRDDDNEFLVADDDS